MIYVEENSFLYIFLFNNNEKHKTKTRMNILKSAEV